MHLTEGGWRIADVTRLWAAARRKGFRRFVPVGIAAVAVLGIVAGGLTVFAAGGNRGALNAGSAGSAVRGSAGPVGSAARAAPGTSPFGLPQVRPTTGNSPVLSEMVGGAVLVGGGVPAAKAPAVAPLRRTLQADLLVVSDSSLPSTLLARVSRIPGVTAAEQIEAVRMRINGAYTAVLGVNPSAFRSFAARPTAASNTLWQGVAGGGIAVSYTMGKLDKLPLGGTVAAVGRKTERLPVVAFGTLGIGGVDGVVSDAVARSLGAPAGNAIVVSTTRQSFNSASAAVGRLVPHGTGVEPLAKLTGTGTAGAGSPGETAVPAAQLNAVLKAAMSRLGMPYVWGGAGPTTFDCSGLVQWSFAQAGIVMPRVAADQALAGPAVPVSELRPGDLLFYHTDPTDPSYISHVAMYLGNGWMIQAPQPGENVQVVRADFGSEFAGAVRVNPAQAASVASRIA